MHHLNVLINTPLAIEKEYLLSIIPGLIMDFHSLKYKSINLDIESKFMEKIHHNHPSENNEMRPVILNIMGPIIKYSTWNQLGTQFYGKIIKSLDADPTVSGILLNIDSGGGMVSGTAELTDIIKSIGTPTISYTNGYQCSAALDIASGCDYHMASKYADCIGSIGTMLSYQDFSAMFEKWGAKIYEIYAPQSSEKNKEVRELFKGNESAYTEKLEVLAQSFIDRMKENYPDLKDDGKVFKGKTYNPEEALEIGLINELGTIEDALNKF